MNVNEINDLNLSNIIDVDGNPNKGYSILYREIKGKQDSDDSVSLYSSEELKNVLDTLTDLQRRVITERYVREGENKSLRQLAEIIAKEMKKAKLSYQYIEQTESDALNKLRSPENLIRFEINLNINSDLLSDKQKSELLEIKQWIENVKSADEVAKGSNYLKKLKIINKIAKSNVKPEEQPVEVLQLKRDVIYKLKRSGVYTLKQLEEAKLSHLLGKISAEGVVESLNKYKLSVYGTCDIKLGSSQDEKREEPSENTINTKKEKTENDINELKLSRGVKFALKKKGINTIEELRGYSEEQLMKIDNIGAGKASLIIERLKEYDLSQKEGTKESLKSRIRGKVDEIVKQEKAIKDQDTKGETNKLKGGD